MGTSVLLVLVSAATASADTPEPRPGSWEPKPDVDIVHAFLLLGGVPLLVFVLIAVMFVGPALVRGEDLSIRAKGQETQWLGGPRKEAKELAAPDAEDSKAGGAGGNW